MMSPRCLLAGRIGGSGAVATARLGLQVFAGVAFVMHGWGNVTEVRGAAAASMQCLGGLLLAVGLLTLLAALGIGVTMGLRQLSHHENATGDLDRSGLGYAAAIMLIN